MLPLGVGRAVSMAIGTVYPAYASFKAISCEDAQAQMVLLVYWITFALFNACELVADTVIFWLPMYSEVKLLALLWLLSPQYRGAVLLYRTVIHGWLQRHQTIIDAQMRRMRLNGYLWAAAEFARLLLGALTMFGQAAWLLAPQQRSTALPLEVEIEETEREVHPVSSASSASSAATAAAPQSARWPRLTAPRSARWPRPAPPLDITQVAELSADLEESCRMLLRSALAAQAGNQLLSTLHDQAQSAAKPSAVMRHAARSQQPAAASDSRSTEKAVHRGRHVTDRRKSRSVSNDR